MEVRPKEMERWGTASILKESARLLHKHYRLFLPFFLAFYVPGSVIPIVFPFFSPARDASFEKGSFNPAQATDTLLHQVLAAIASWTLLDLLISIAETLGTGAVVYITAYLCSNTPTDTYDDRSIVPKVFKLLPHAFLRLFITGLWASLAVLILFLCFVIIGLLLYAFPSAGSSWSDLIVLFFAIVSLFIFLASLVYLIVMFALAQVVAVLEPGNYGRKALKRSVELARIGRARTIVAVLLIEVAYFAVLSVTMDGVMTAKGGMPLWAKVVLGALVQGLSAVFNVYFGVVSVVLYLVYKARVDGAESAGIPMFKLTDSAGHSYEPLVQEKGSVTSVS